MTLFFVRNSLDPLPQSSFKKLIHLNTLIHDPVMLPEVLQALHLKPGMTVVDGTLGLAGHSSEILKAIGPKGFLHAFDRDTRNIALSIPRLQQVGSNFRVHHDSFSSLKDRLRREGVSQVDALLFDLGLSSPHLDDPERGFSFLREGPLDMRFDPTDTLTAANILAKWSEKDLADIFFKYGEEPKSRRLARAIVEQRKIQPLTRTTELTALVEEAIGKGKPGKHRATQIFQALRMAVNEELKALELGLNQAIELLAPHGRVVVLSYHSLEDRLVKQIFKSMATDLCDPTDIYGRRVLRKKSLSLLTKKPILPTPEEVQRNPRARSAKLRAAEKLPF